MISDWIFLEIRQVFRIFLVGNSCLLKKTGFLVNTEHFHIIETHVFRKP